MARNAKHIPHYEDRGTLTHPTRASGITLTEGCSLAFTSMQQQEHHVQHHQTVGGTRWELPLPWRLVGDSHHGLHEARDRHHRLLGEQQLGAEAAMVFCGWQGQFR